MNAKKVKLAVGTTGAAMLLGAGLFGYSGDMLAAWALSCIGFYGLGVSTVTIVDRKMRGIPPHRIQLLDKDGKEKPRGKVGIA